MDLQQFFEENPRVALAFSGGTDSAYLLYAGVRYGARIKAYCVKSAFQPKFEEEDARRLAEELGAELVFLPLDILSQAGVTANPPDRCYHCKRLILKTVLAAAEADGFTVLADGTNATDAPEGRPGMKVLTELAVRSPLRECGLTKQEIRRLSREAGLFTYDKPAYACLATRIPTGEPITLQKLRRTEAAEAWLAGLGLRDFRVRTANGIARLQVTQQDLPLVIEQREAIVERLKKDYSGVVLDMEVRK